MRASSLSSSKVINLINDYFVPVHLRNQDFADDGSASPGEKSEKTRIYHEALKAGMPAGTVCVYLLSSDAHPIAVAPLNQRVATDPDQLADLMRKVVEQLNIAKGPVVQRPPPSTPTTEPGSLLLQLTARYLERRGNDFVRPDKHAILGTKQGGNWGDLPSQDWIEIDRSDWIQWLPTADLLKTVRPGTTWEIDGAAVLKVFQHFFPPTENTNFAKNRLDEFSLQVRAESVTEDRVQASLAGKIRMKHPFYHVDDNNFVDATFVGTMEFDRTGPIIRTFRLVTDHATYGSPGNSPQFFGVAVRSMP